jgi:hypothetical protein
LRLYKRFRAKQHKLTRPLASGLPTPQIDPYKNTLTYCPSVGYKILFSNTHDKYHPDCVAAFFRAAQFETV